MTMTAKMEGAKDGSDTTQLEAQLDDDKGELKGLGFWGVAVYDYGVFLHHINFPLTDYCHNRYVCHR
jgi:hypothetical protein